MRKSSWIGYLEVLAWFCMFKRDGHVVKMIIKLLLLFAVSSTLHSPTLGMQQISLKEIDTIRGDFLAEPLPLEQEAELFIAEVLETEEKFYHFKMLLEEMSIKPGMSNFLNIINTSYYQNLKNSPLIKPEIKKIYLQLYNPQHFEFIRQRILAHAFPPAGVFKRLYELAWVVIMLVLAEQNKIQSLKNVIKMLGKMSLWSQETVYKFFRENSWLINMPLFVVSLTNDYFMYIPEGKALSLNTPLMATIGLGKQFLAQWFIEHGSLIDCQNSLGYSAFIWFLRYEFLHPASTDYTQDQGWTKWFLRHKADINLPNYEGRTPLEDAIIGKQILLAEYLVLCGADCKRVSATDGRTVLMTAAAHNLYRETNFLLMQGADPEVVGDEGKRASEFATDHHVQQLLQGWEEVRKNQREIDLEKAPCDFVRCDIDDFIFGILERMLNVPESKRLRVFLQSTHRSATTTNELFNTLLNYELLRYVRMRICVLKQDCKEVKRLVEALHWISNSLVRKKLGNDDSEQLNALMYQVYHEKYFDLEKWFAFLKKNPWLANSPVCYEIEEKKLTETLLVHAVYAECLPLVAFLFSEAKVDINYPTASGCTPWMIAENIEVLSVKEAIQELLSHSVQH